MFTSQEINIINTRCEYKNILILTAFTTSPNYLYQESCLGSNEESAQMWFYSNNTLIPHFTTIEDVFAVKSSTSDYGLIFWRRSNIEDKNTNPNWIESNLEDKEWQNFRQFCC
jgi:hypothetical protein